jgi:hypothetical protein
MQRRRPLIATSRPLERIQSDLLANLVTIQWAFVRG